MYKIRKAIENIKNNKTPRGHKTYQTIRNHRFSIQPMSKMTSTETMSKMATYMSRAEMKKIEKYSTAKRIKLLKERLVGFFYPSKNSIFVNTDGDVDVANVLVHEIQHYLFDKEHSDLYKKKLDNRYLNQLFLEDELKARFAEKEFNNEYITRFRKKDEKKYVLRVYADCFCKNFLEEELKTVQE